MLHAIVFFAPFSYALPQNPTILSPRADAVSENALADAGIDIGLEADSQAGGAQWPPPPPPQEPNTQPQFPHFPFFGGPSAEDKRRVELKRRADAVKAAFIHSWEPYKAFGLPDDELRPASKEPYSTRCV